jgi:hypothetical protein
VPATWHTTWATGTGGSTRPDDPDHLLQRFYGWAPTEAAWFIAAAVGRTLQRGEPLEPALRDRLTRLREYCADAVRRGADAHELTEFDSWFASGAFDDEWALDQLRQVLVLTPEMTLEPDVLKRLRTQVIAHPHACLEVLQHRRRRLAVLKRCAPLGPDRRDHHCGGVRG